jgi:hypothetical protein
MPFIFWNAAVRTVKNFLKLRPSSNTTGSYKEMSSVGTFPWKCLIQRVKGCFPAGAADCIKMVVRDMRLSCLHLSRRLLLRLFPTDATGTSVWATIAITVVQQTYDPITLTPITFTLRIFVLTTRNCNFGLTPCCNNLLTRIVTLNNLLQNID